MINMDCLETNILKFCFQHIDITKTKTQKEYSNIIKLENMKLWKCNKNVWMYWSERNVCCNNKSIFV
jgi:hypothetical protein